MSFFTSRFEEESDQHRSFFRRRGFYRFLAVLLAFGVFAGVVRIAYEEGVKSGTRAILPIVRAEKEPIKVRPEKPGGMAVPFQDKLVYGQLAERDPEQPETIRLLPPPEEPVAPPEAAEAPPKTELLQRMESEATVPQTQTEPETEPLEAAPAPPGEKGVRIQVASMRFETQAKVQWARLQEAEPDLLGALKLYVERVDLGEKGVFFRVQAGPLTGVAAAKDLCTRLQQRKLGCLVVRP